MPTDKCVEDNSNPVDDPPDNKDCFIEKITSETLDITGECPELNIELKVVEEEEVEPCKFVTSMMNNDVIKFERNGNTICIKFSDLLAQLGCKKECL